MTDDECRTHRARTEQYVLGLESEVGRLRLAHADCVALVKSMHQKLGQVAPEYAYEESSIAAQNQTPGQVSSHSASEPTIVSYGSRANSASDAQQMRLITNAMLNSEIGLEFVMR